MHRSRTEMNGRSLISTNIWCQFSVLYFDQSWHLPKTTQQHLSNRTPKQLFDVIATTQQHPSNHKINMKLHSTHYPSLTHTKWHTVYSTMKQDNKWKKKTSGFDFIYQELFIYQEFLQKKKVKTCLLVNSNLPCRVCRVKNCKWFIIA